MLRGFVCRVMCLRSLIVVVPPHLCIIVVACSIMCLCSRMSVVRRLGVFLLLCVAVLSYYYACPCRDIVLFRITLIIIMVCR